MDRGLHLLLLIALGAAACPVAAGAQARDEPALSTQQPQVVEPAVQRREVERASIDTEKLQVTAQAGTTIADLNELLFQYGMAMPNLGDIAYQTISGAISTSTHGTGAKLTATLLREMQRRDLRYGMVTMCVGGGQGAAGIFELL